MAQSSSLDFSLDRDEWELACFADRIGFVVIAHCGRGPDRSPRWFREDFGRDQLREAIHAACQPTVNGKPRLLYCVIAEGRQIVLDRNDHPLWLRRAGFGTYPAQSAVKRTDD
jgi:hypothetical protein